MAHLYDLILLVDPNAPDERQSAIVTETRSMIESGGQVVTDQDWATRRMSFEIDHRPEAAYHLFQFEGENDLLERLRHTLRIADGVMRFRIIRIKPGTPPPNPPRPDRAERPQREDEGEGRVAARAAADAPAEAPAEAPPAEAPEAPEAPAEAPTEAPDEEAPEAPEE